MTLIMAALSVLFIGLQVYDVITTQKGIKSGKAVEANPAAAFLFKYLPPDLWWVGKFEPMLGPAAFWCVFLLGYEWVAIAVLAAFDVWYGYTVWNNYKIVNP